MVAEADDSLMEKFFEAGTLTQEELSAGLSRAVRSGALFPVFCASGLSNIGLQPLADAILTYVPSPVERPMQGRTRRAARRPERGRQRPTRAVGLEDRGRSVRRPDHDVPRRVRRLEVGRDGAQHHP
jgi:translation elongation factor EF-G